MPELISSPNVLQHILSLARERGMVALDTEFVWTNTYYPRVGLVQAGISSAETWLIDVPALTDVSSLAEMMADPNIVKILHDATCDLTILHRLCGTLPQRIFDMRLAAGFCGLPATLSLANLAGELLDVHLPKTESRSDWLQRPLSPEQLQYATDDVRHMPDMYLDLHRRLETCGNLPWALEEMARYEHPDMYRETPPDETYRNIKGMGKLPPKHLAILREVTAWREITARRDDRTRSRILKDEHLIDIARRVPENLAELRRVKGLWRRTLKQYADGILAAVRQGAATPPDQWPRLTASPIHSREIKDHADTLLAVIRKTAQEKGIDPTLVGPRRSVVSLILAAARGNLDGHPLLRGWRAELLGGTMEQVLAERGLM